MIHGGCPCSRNSSNFCFHPQKAALVKSKRMGQAHASDTSTHQHSSTEFSQLFHLILPWFCLPPLLQGSLPQYQLFGLCLACAASLMKPCIYGNTIFIYFPPHTRYHQVLPVSISESTSTLHPGDRTQRNFDENWCSKG